MASRLALAATLLTASLVTTTPASAYIASNGLIVQDVGNGQFNVPFMGLSGAPDFWCAAADYVIFRLDLPRSTRIYRVSEPPRRSGEGILFQLSKEGAASKSGVTTFGGPDQGLSASLAQTFCETRWPYGWGLF